MQQLMIDAKEAEQENVRVQTAKDSAARDSGQKTTAAKTTGRAGQDHRRRPPMPAKTSRQTPSRRTREQTGRARPLPACRQVKSL